MTQLCDDADMQGLMAAIASDDTDEIAQIDRILARYPDDPRLHFLRGSVLAGIGRPIEALAALKTAVALAPDFAIARFQLGFFQLTSGEAADALGTWGPLALLPDGHYLRLFVTGLTYLIRDEFPQAVAALGAGIDVNVENPPLNRDMQLIIDKVRAIPTPREDAPDETMSATSLLLGQFGGSRTPQLTSIGPADHVLLLLREQLKTADRARSKTTERPSRTAATGARERLQALAAVADLPERDFRRAMVRGLLAERLGEELVADPAFEAAVIEIARIIEDSHEAKLLLDRAAGTLRKR